MSAGDCRLTRSRLGAFVDGELSGRERLAVTRHLQACGACEQEAEALRELGAALRAQAPGVDASALRGLAAGVLSRVGAEDAQSWRVRLRGAFEDWHWVVVGTGSLLGTAACTLLVASMLLFGPSPERADSLAGQIRLKTADTSAGALFVLGTPAGDNMMPMLMQFEGAGSPASGTQPTLMPPSLGVPDESELTYAMADMVMRGGKLIEFSALSEQQRRQTDALLDDIHKLHLPDQYAAPGPVTVHGLWLVTQASVSAKAL